MSGGVGAGRIEDFDFYMGFLSSSVATRQLRLRAARPFCRSMPMAFPTFPPFCGGIARSGKPLCGCNAPELGKARDLLTQDFYMFLRCRYKQCKAREGQKGRDRPCRSSRSFARSSNAAMRRRYAANAPDG